MNALLLVASLHALAAAPAAPATASRALLARDGKALASIVLPEDASPTIDAAARELARYLREISGATFPIIKETASPAGTRIDLGPTRATLARTPPDLAGDAERVWIDARPDGVTICGGDDRGALFAVYRFLERLGCRWLTPEPENELVPRRTSLALDPFHLDTRPAFAWRLFSSRSPESERWGPKIGMNGFFSAEGAPANGGCIHWPREIHGVHAYHQILPAKRHFASHPEWNPLLDGERVPTSERRNQLCVTADGIADEFSASVLRAFERDPSAPLVSISPNDGAGWCECDACLALDRRLCGARTTRQGLARERPFMGDRVFWFANEVAERVGRVRPDKSLLVLAYINYAEPPDTIRPRPNVVPFLCHYAPADYSRPIDDPASEANRQFHDLLGRWMKIAPHLMIYSYVSKSMWWRLPRPILHNFARDVKTLHRLGVRRYYCQSPLADWPLDGPLYSVIARLLWDPAADPDAVAREWIDAMFGPAAGDLAEFYAQVEAAVRKTGKPYSDHPSTQAAGLYDRPCLDRAMAALECAERAARTDPDAARRVAEVARTFRYGYWMIESLEQAEKLQGTGDPACLEAARDAGQKALGYCYVREAEDYLKRWKTSAQLGAPNTGFGKEEIKGGRRCWNSDETGPGDNACGWATFHLMTPDRTRPLALEMDVWGESDLHGVSVNTRKDLWTPIRPLQRLSRKPRWETLTFQIPPEAMDPDRAAQHIGFGGADSQIWVAAIRAGNAAPARH